MTCETLGFALLEALSDISHNTSTRPHHIEIMVWWTVGCIYGATSVALGAFGAHGLKKRIADPSKLAVCDIRDQ